MAVQSSTFCPLSYSFMRTLKKKKKKPSEQRPSTNIFQRWRCVWSFVIPTGLGEAEAGRFVSLNVLTKYSDEQPSTQTNKETKGNCNKAVENWGFQYKQTGWAGCWVAVPFLVDFLLRLSCKELDTMGRWPELSRVNTLQRDWFLYQGNI